MVGKIEKRIQLTPTRAHSQERRSKRMIECLFNTHHVCLDEEIKKHRKKEYVQVLFVFVHVVKTEYVRMFDQLHDGDFSFHLHTVVK